jgi:hypothetical protein
MMWIFGVIVFVLLVSIRAIAIKYHERCKVTDGKIWSASKFWRLVLPVIDSITKVDIRVKAVVVPNQEAISRMIISQLE